MEILKPGGRVSRTVGLIFIFVSAVAVSAASAQTLTTVVSFNGSDGAQPLSGLIADANGDLFGTTPVGGAYHEGMVFEITNSSGVYASAPTTLASFNASDGAQPRSGLIADANGDLFGTTSNAGPYGRYGTVFEVTNNSGVYATTPTILVDFNVGEGLVPVSGLIADANGDLFGTTLIGGADNLGTVFEITKSSSGVYSSTPITLVSFNGSDGGKPYSGLIADANGNLFGTTEEGGANGDGTVFEITKSSSGVYSGTPIILASFSGSDGANPVAGLIADANGNLFGTTELGGPNGDGTVFEIANSSGVYAGTPTTLVSFSGSDGEWPLASLIADAKGNLFSTTQFGGAEGEGTVFEVTGSGFVPPKQFAGTPGAANCVGMSVSAMAQTYGGIAHAAAALGYSSVKDLQSAVAGYCTN